MPSMWMDVDAALAEVPVNIMPLLDDTDFKTRETGVVYNSAGMDLTWNFCNTAGAMSQTAVTPTTGGNYDWAHQGDGIYSIEIPASGGASINNDTEGFGWFTGVCTGVLPWRGPIIGFRAVALNNSMVDGTTIDVNATAINGVATTSVTTVSAYQGTTQPVNFTGTGATAYVKTDMVDIAGAAVSATTAQVGVNVVNAAGTAWGSGAITDSAFATATYPKALRTAAVDSAAAGYVALDGSASSTNDTYTGCSIKIVSGTGIGQSRTIILYVGATKRAYIDRVWATNPAGGDVFVINTGKLTLDVVNAGIATAGDGTTITLASTAVATNNYYDGAIIQIVSGTGLGQSRVISGYVGATKVATVADGWATNPDNTSVYVVRGLGDVEVGVCNDKTGYSLVNGSIANATFAADVGSTAYATNIIALAAEKGVINYGALKPTTASRTLDVTATGAAGIDWGNVENQTTTVGLTNTTISTSSTFNGNVTSINSSTTAANSLAGILTGTGSVLTLSQLRIDSAAAGGAIDIDNSNGAGVAINGSSQSIYCNDLIYVKDGVVITNDSGAALTLGAQIGETEPNTVGLQINGLGTETALEIISSTTGVDIVSSGTRGVTIFHSGTTGSALYIDSDHGTAATLNSDDGSAFIVQSAGSATTGIISSAAKSIEILNSAGSLTTNANTTFDGTFTITGATTIDDLLTISAVEVNDYFRTPETGIPVNLGSGASLAMNLKDMAGATFTTGSNSLVDIIAAIGTAGDGNVVSINSSTSAAASLANILTGTGEELTLSKLTIDNPSGTAISIQSHSGHAIEVDAPGSGSTSCMHLHFAGISGNIIEMNHGSGLIDSETGYAIKLRSAGNCLSAYSTTDEAVKLTTSGDGKYGMNTSITCIGPISDLGSGTTIGQNLVDISGTGFTSSVHSLSALHTDIATIDTDTSNIYDIVNNATYGNNALQGLITTLDGIADTINTNIGAPSNLGTGASVAKNLVDMAGASFTTTTDSLAALSDAIAASGSGNVTSINSSTAAAVSLSEMLTGVNGNSLTLKSISVDNSAGTGNAITVTSGTGGNGITVTGENSGIVSTGTYEYGINAQGNVSGLFGEGTGTNSHGIAGIGTGLSNGMLLSAAAGTGYGLKVYGANITSTTGNALIISSTSGYAVDLDGTTGAISATGNNLFEGKTVFTNTGDTAMAIGADNATGLVIGASSSESGDASGIEIVTHGSGTAFKATTTTGNTIDLNSTTGNVIDVLKSGTTTGAAVNLVGNINGLYIEGTNGTGTHSMGYTYSVQNEGEVLINGDFHAEGDLYLGGGIVTEGVSNFGNTVTMTSLVAPEIGTPSNLGSGASLAKNAVDIFNNELTSLEVQSACSNALSAAGTSTYDPTTDVVDGTTTYKIATEQILAGISGERTLDRDTFEIDYKKRNNTTTSFKLKKTDDDVTRTAG